MPRLRAAPIARPKQAAAAKASPPHRPPVAGHQHRGHASPLLRLQEAAGNKAVIRMLQREATVEPAARDALMAAAKTQIEQGLALVPSLLPLAGELQAQGAGPAPSASGMAGGPPSPSPALGMGLRAKLQMAGGLLDGGIKLYQQAGGHLGDIDHVVKARAQLSTAAFFVQQVLAGATPLAPQVMAHVLSAIREGQQSKIDEAISAATAANAEQGGQTGAQANQQQAQDAVLQVMLGPFGAGATIAP